MTTRGFTRAAIVPVFFMLFLIISFVGSHEASAEGSKELISNGGDRPSLEWDIEQKLMDIERTTTLYVYVKEGETIRLGSSVYNSYDTGSSVYKDISVTPPGGSARVLDVVKNGAGHIRTLEMEQAGPKYTIDSVVFNSTGYTPLNVDVGTGESGWWKVEFHGPATKGNPVKKTTKDALADNGSGADIEAWDVTVTAADGTPKTGRLFTYSLAMNMGSNGASLKSIVYVLTKDGYTYKTNMNGIDPYGYLFFSNSRGFIDNTSGGTLYHSVPFTAFAAKDVTVQNPNGADSVKAITHRVFFNEPSRDLPADVPTQPVAPPKPQSFAFSKVPGAGPVTGVGQGGSFSFALASPATYQIVLDTDGTPGYNASTDTVIENFASSGTNTLIWNGKKRDGTNLPAGSYKAQITSKGGEYHFPMLDVEYATNGIIIESLHQPTGLNYPSGMGATTVYYDDSNYVTAGGNTVCMSGGTTTCSANPAGSPNPLVALGGVSSLGGAHAYSNNYGNDKAIDTWTYFPGEQAELTFSVVEGSVSGKVFQDTNLNGILDIGEKGVPGVQIQVTDPITLGTYTLTTDAQGFYSLPVNNGDVLVAMNTSSLPAGYSLTSASAKATLTVNNDAKTANFGVGSHAPVALNGSNTTNKNTLVKGQLSATDADDDTLTYSKVDDPQHGTVIVNTDGTYTYTPNANYVGTDTFTFKANDGQQDSNTATVTITVNAVNHAPTAIGADIIISVNGSVYNGTLTGNDPDSGDTLSFNIVSEPSHGTVVVHADGTFTYQPTPGYGGTDSFTFTVTDQGGLVSAPATVNLTIAEAGTYVIKMAADPQTLIGNGRSTSHLTATLVDSNGAPVPGVTVKFNAEAGSFPEGAEAVTDANGHAVIMYQTSKITGTESQIIRVNAVVEDTQHGIYANGQIHVTFQPAAIRGVIASTVNGARVVESGVTVRITNASIGFAAETVTDAQGQYSIVVPQGDLVYEVEIVKTVQVGGETKEVSFKQQAHVGAVTGSGEEYFDSDKVATGIIVLAKPDGSKKLLDELNTADQGMAANLKIKIKDPVTGQFITVQGESAFNLNPSGVFSIPGLVKGKEYELAIVYSLTDAGHGGAKKEIIINALDQTGALPKFKLSEDGELNILDELVDPYGDVTDKLAGTAVDGADVKLYYADTARNRANGITPGTLVVLPQIPGFLPNDNANPQTSTQGGKYAYMVYPQTDYYIVVTAAGYVTYTSPTIPVEFAIVRHDAALDRLTNGGGTPTSSPVPSIPTPDKNSSPDLTVNLSVERSTQAESTTGTVTVKYRNNGTATAQEAQIVLTIPEGVEVVDAAGGTVIGHTIVWKVGDVSVAQGGSYIVKLKWPAIGSSEQQMELSAAASSKNAVATENNAAASLKVLVFSGRHGDVEHTRYILGYPDAKFHPQRTLSRAELAAIIARLINGGTTTLKAEYSDIRPGHWASGYIRIASDNGIFTGYADGSFHPDSPVTREELAAVMVRYLKLKVSAPIDTQFADAQGRWSSAAIEALFRNALTTGYPDGSFKPSAPIIREEAVTMINRLLFRGPLQGVQASFPDMKPSQWAFGQVEEATRSHASEREAYGGETFIRGLSDNVK